eukprot:gene58479-80072_t
MADLFFASAFRDRFEAKGRYRDYMRAIPTALIIDPQAALTGSGRRLTAHRMAQGRHAMNRRHYAVTLQQASEESPTLASPVIGYGALATAVSAVPTAWAVLAGVVAILALYRAGSFIHELTHLKATAVPGFRLVWNLLVGIPLMVPSFLYEGVHSLHHARTRYGTSEDPEYLPLALMKPWTLPLFVVVAALAPIALFVRFALLAPLSLVIPPL